MRNVGLYIVYMLLHFVASRFEPRQFQYIIQEMHSVIHHYDIYRLLHVSASRCHPQGVVITQVTC